MSQEKAGSGILDSLTESVRSRFSDPIIGSYITFFIVFNYDLFIYMFSSEPTLERLAYISERLGIFKNFHLSQLTYNDYFSHLLVIKGWHSLRYIIPAILTWFYVFKWPKIAKEWLKQAYSLKEDLVDVQNSVKLRGDIANMQDQLRNEKEKNGAVNRDVTAQLSSKLSELAAQRTENSALMGQVSLISKQKENIQKNVKHLEKEIASLQEDVHKHENESKRLSIELNQLSHFRIQVKDVLLRYDDNTKGDKIKFDDEIDKLNWLINTLISKEKEFDELDGRDEDSMFNEIGNLSTFRSFWLALREANIKLLPILLISYDGRASSKEKNDLKNKLEEMFSRNDTSSFVKKNMILAVCDSKSQAMSVILPSEVIHEHGMLSLVKPDMVTLPVRYLIPEELTRENMLSVVHNMFNLYHNSLTKKSSE